VETGEQNAEALRAALTKKVPKGYYVSTGHDWISITYDTSSR